MNQKKSLGKLREAQKTKPLSPEMVGQMHPQSDTIAAITTHLHETGTDEAVCNIAAWVNRDANGQYLTVQLSPPYVHHNQQPRSTNNLDFIFGGEEDS
jgi:hypothetical protein